MIVYVCDHCGLAEIVDRTKDPEVNALRPDHVDLCSTCEKDLRERIERVQAAAERDFLRECKAWRLVEKDEPNADGSKDLEVVKP